MLISDKKFNKHHDENDKQKRKKKTKVKDIHVPEVFNAENEFLSEGRINQSMF